MGTLPHPSATPADAPTGPPPSDSGPRPAAPPARRGTKRKPPEKPPKPFPGFELFAHDKGYWCKKIDGQQRPFGKWHWPDRAEYDRSWRAARAAYNQFMEDRAHGRLLAAKPDLMTIGVLVDAYLTHQHGRAVGKKRSIKSASFAECRRVVKEFREFVGRDTTVGQLEVLDPLRQKDNPAVRYIGEMGERYGWYAFNKRMGIVSGMWTWAEHPLKGVLGRPFRLKTLFERREDLLRRREKEQKVQERGKQRWTPDEVAALFAFARQPLRAKLKLGYFAGYGNSDCADLYQAAITWEPDKEHELPAGWGLIHFMRPKTLIERACVLPATAMDDLREALAMRPEAADPAWKNLVFLTKYGNPWVRDAVYPDPENPEQIGNVVTIDSIAGEFAKLRDRLARCPEHGWFGGGRNLGPGFRADVRGMARVKARPEAPVKCPVCGGKLQPMRKLGFYTFRHTAVTDASGAADLDTLLLFEGRTVTGSRKHYLEEVEVHRLRPIAEKLLRRHEAASPPCASVLPVTQSASTARGRGPRTAAGPVAPAAPGSSPSPAA